VVFLKALYWDLFFFLLYVNDLVRLSEFFRFVLFADDTNLFATAKTRGALYKKVRDELSQVSDWFACNKVTLNYKKTEYSCSWGF
jgi:hypothetical protein